MFSVAQSAAVARSSPFPTESRPTPSSAPLLALVDAAAAAEAQFQDLARQIQDLHQELRAAQSQSMRRGRALVQLRRSHRRSSHSTTAQLFKRIVTEEALAPRRRTNGGPSTNESHS
jgi:hypothetical protein